MTDIGRGVTKEGLTYHIIYIHVYISFVQFIPVYVGLTQARPNYRSNYSAKHSQRYENWCLK